MGKKEFYSKKLGNGMKVILEHRKKSGVVSLAFAVRHGGIHENEKDKGISHFIEHMLFKGTKNRTSKQISEAIEKNGGILNAFTDEEVTAYWCKIPSNKLAIALDVLSDMLLNPLFDEKELDKERRVIFEEMKMRKDRPDVYILDKIQSFLFTGNLGMDIIGTVKSMSSIDKEKITDKFKKVYGSQNMILCAVGDVEFNKLCGFCEKTFKRSNFKIPEPKIGIKTERKKEKRHGIDQANLIFAYHMPRANQSTTYTSKVLNCLMAGGMSSRLFQEIREKRNLAYAVKGGYNGGRRFGYGSVFVGTSPENVEKVKQLIIEEFRKVKSVGEKEIRQVKDQLIGNSKISREESHVQMLDLLYNEIWKDNASSSYKYESEIKKVRLEDVKKMAEAAKQYSFIALVPDRIGGKGKK